MGLSSAGMSRDPLAALAALEQVGSAYAAARDGIDAMLRDRGLRRTTPADTVESLRRGAHATALLEGSPTGLADLPPAADPVAAAALRVSGELLSLAPLLGTSPLQALARVHVLASPESLPAGLRGRPADPAGASRLRDLGRLLREPTGAPALLVAALAHAELATARPFGAAHAGIVARATERLVLVARGVDPASVTVPEAGHLALRAAYESNLRAYADGGRAGVVAWLVYAAQAYAAGAEASPLRARGSW